MGNSALRELAVIEEITFDEVAGSVVAVDAHNWLYRYLTTTVRWTSGTAYTTADGTEVPNLIAIIRGLPKFYEHDMTPIFVFDGAVTQLKDDEVAERREAKDAAAEAMAEAKAAGNYVEASRLESHAQRLTPVIQTTTRELFDILDVPYLDAPAEGEGQAAYMAKTDAVDYVGSEDYDALLFGAPLTLRQLTSKGDPELMDYEKTLKSLDLTQSALVDVAILCGTDFNEGLAGYGPKTALAAIREHGDLDSVLDDAGATIPQARAVRDLFLDPAVTDAYHVPTRIEPNLHAARTYLTRTWGIPLDTVETGLDRLEEAVTQTGLDQFG